eukprot:CAMPEP_0169144742 /NCGR_PEP_ID=MMETSP1015-20121227/46468_1 /TAXON_ID=342587 /ORGANISM="Karlodinium micrum, Strain CCMP2283" /LENGTH=141 /DNA_ID=CAMNT_0009212141 /DNA_START=30 /DNA_END=452 /DNA_ORIENTATION=-
MSESECSSAPNRCVKLRGLWNCGSVFCGQSCDGANESDSESVGCSEDHPCDLGAGIWKWLCHEDFEEEPDLRTAEELDREPKFRQEPLTDIEQERKCASCGCCMLSQSTSQAGAEDAKESSSVMCDMGASVASTSAPPSPR